MAYQDDPLYQQGAQVPGGANQVLAGNSGVTGGGAGSQPVGSGFTNLQTYLNANRDQAGGAANQIAAGGQEGFQDRVKSADNLAAGVTATGTQAAQSGGQVANESNGFQYGGPNSASDVKGFNSLDENYKAAEDYSNNYANDFNANKAALQKTNGYGNGFAALDTFLGRQDGGANIRAGNQAQVAGLKDGTGYKGTQGAKANIETAIAGGKNAAANAQATFKKQQDEAAARAAQEAADKAAKDAADKAAKDAADKAARDAELIAKAGLPVNGNVAIDLGMPTGANQAPAAAPSGATNNSGTIGIDLDMPYGLPLRKR